MKKPYTVLYTIRENGREMFSCLHAENPDDAISQVEIQEERNYDRKMDLQITKIRPGYHL